MARIEGHQRERMRMGTDVDSPDDRCGVRGGSRVAEGSWSP